MKKLIWIIAALLLSACHAEVADDSCDQASSAALGAINAAGACSDAISSAPDTQSAERLADCILLHGKAVEQTQATENACANQDEVVAHIREARRNLQRTSELLDTRLRAMKGDD